MRLEGIAIRDFPPFARHGIRFGARHAECRADVHIFVGQNGTGKTRLLTLLLAALGNKKDLEDRISSPPEAAVFASKVGERGPTSVLFWQGGNSLKFRDDVGIDATMAAYINSAQFGGNYEHIGQDLIGGANDGGIGMAFQAAAAVRDEKITPMAPVNWGKVAELLSFSPNATANASLCQSIANMKIRTGMHLANDPGSKPDRITRMSSRLEAAVTRITARQFSFVVEQEGNEVRLKVVWGGVRMLLRQLPDGLRSIIGWLASCVAKADLALPKSEDPLNEALILVLDEPETHLHPAWQRQVLPALMALLPNAQIFVATHSPFVVSSVNCGWIYIFKADADGSVQIAPPTPCSKGDSYIDAVEDTLGLKEWFDPETEGMLEQFRGLREAAIKTGAPNDADAMRSLAAAIAGRSQTLEAMMGRELAQFSSRAKVNVH